MIKETYVTFEQAKGLKEIGFPQEYDDFSGINSHYNSNGYRCFHSDIGIYDDVVCACPTQALAQKWLREEKGFDILPFRSGQDCYTKEYHPSIIFKEAFGFTDCGIMFGKTYDTYENALAEAISKAIELIQNQLQGNMTEEITNKQMCEWLMQYPDDAVVVVEYCNVKPRYDKETNKIYFDWMDNEQIKQILTSIYTDGGEVVNTIVRERISHENLNATRKMEVFVNDTLQSLKVIIEQL